MDFKQYPSYKDSGVKWLGEVPEHWQVKKLKNIGTSIIGLTYSPSDICDANNESHLVMRSSNIQNGKISLIDNVYVNCEVSEKLKLKHNDILICSRNGSKHLIGKNIILKHPKSHYTFGAFMTVFRCNSPDFIYWVLNSIIFKAQAGSYLTTTVNQLTINNLNNMIVPFPSKEEQAQIVSFLDSETSRIDNLISKQEKLIEKLEEHRKSVISHAVTKGLDPNAPMKDSGSGWLGEVPEHWGCGKFKKVVQSYLSGCWGDDPYDDEQDTIVLRSTEQTVNGFWKIENPATRYISPKEIKGKYLKRNDLLLTKSSGSSNHIEKTTLVDENVEAMNCTFSNFMMCIRLSGKVFPKFYWYILNSEIGRSQFDFLSQTTTGLSNLNESHVGSLIVPMLSIEEQKEIANFLDLESHKINKTIDAQKQLIEKLKEYRTSIISHAVTGKIDVRDLVA